jgi:hypothetical protein
MLMQAGLKLRCTIYAAPQMLVNLSVGAQSHGMVIQYENIIPSQK